MNNPFPGKDASILAWLAKSANRRGNDMAQQLLISLLSCEDTKQIGKHIINLNYDNSFAKAFLDWANSLKANHNDPQ